MIKSPLCRLHVCYVCYVCVCIIHSVLCVSRNRISKSKFRLVHVVYHCLKTHRRFCFYWCWWWCVYLCFCVSVRERDRQKYCQGQSTSRYLFEDNHDNHAELSKRLSLPLQACMSAALCCELCPVLTFSVYTMCRN